MVGIIPVLAAIVVDEQMLQHSQLMGKQFSGFLQQIGLRDPDRLARGGLLRGEAPNRQLLLSVIGLERLRRIATKMFDESEFLSPASNGRWTTNFNEDFHGDNGAGLGASHQTGWTGLVADLIRRRHGAVQALGYSLRASDPRAAVSSEAIVAPSPAD